MDEVIFEEFKGTGNCELHLDRKLMEKRIFPDPGHQQVGYPEGGTAAGPHDPEPVWILRQLLHPLNVLDAMEFLLDKLSRYETNRQFLNSMNQ
jgi:transcription termination factor Rho